MNGRLDEMYPDLLRYFPEHEYQRNDWLVRRFFVREEEIRFEQLRDRIKRRNQNGGMMPGWYLGLYHRGELVMSNTWMEKITNVEFVQQARGNVLIGGLGLGMVVLAILQKPDIDHVTIIEKSPEVVDLVGSRLPKDQRLTILLGDVTVTDHFKPLVKFDVIYFDIWSNTPNEDDLRDIVQLKRRWRKFLRSGGWMRAWREDEARRRAPTNATEGGKCPSESH